MTTIHSNQANKHIKKILPENLAAIFFSSRATIMAITHGIPTTLTIERLMETINITLETFNNLVSIYQELSKTSFSITDRVNTSKTISSERTLLGKLTDGSSHLKIYPNVDFNS
jgi:hypothetical protein